jgi:hypothetical protein
LWIYTRRINLFAFRAWRFGYQEVRGEGPLGNNMNSTHLARILSSCLGHGRKCRLAIEALDSAATWKRELEFELLLRVQIVRYPFFELWASVEFWILV